MWLESLDSVTVPDFMLKVKRLNALKFHEIRSRFLEGFGPLVHFCFSFFILKSQFGKCMKIGAIQRCSRRVS